MPFNEMEGKKIYISMHSCNEKKSFYIKFIACCRILNILDYTRHFACIKGIGPQVIIFNDVLIGVDLQPI